LFKWPSERLPNPDKPEKSKHEIRTSKQIRNSNPQKGRMELSRIHWTNGGDILDTNHCRLCFGHLNFDIENLFRISNLFSATKNTNLRTKGLIGLLID